MGKSRTTDGGPRVCGVLQIGADGSVRDYLEDRLDAATVTRLDEGADAVPALLGGGFDCVVCGPDTDHAIETLVEDLDAAVPSVPVVVIDPDGSPDVASAVVAAGADGYVPTDVDLDPLADRVRELVGESTSDEVGCVPPDEHHPEVASLREETEGGLYELFIELAPNAILVVDPGREEVIETNRAATDILGRPRDVLLGGRVTDLVAPDYRDRFVDLFERAWASGTPVSTRDSGEPSLELQTGEGTRIGVEVDAQRIDLGDRSVLLAIVQDVSERDRRERLLSVMNRVLRHNLRNDVNVILGHADAVLGATEEGSVRRSALTIRDRATGLTDLSRKVRRLQRVTDPEDATGSIDLAEAVRSVASVFDRQYPDAAVTATTPDGPVEVFGPQVELAVEELCENAVVHAGDDPVVTVTLDVDRESSMASVRVTDDGSGLPDSERVSLDGREETPLDHGSGVGLWIVGWIVEDLGGETSVETGEDGTTVTLRVPLAGSDGSDGSTSGIPIEPGAE